MMNAA